MGIAAKIPGWAGLRAQALDRDGWRCCECGKAGRLEVHHVKPLKDGGSNRLSNLRTLCVSCHIAAHRPILPPERAAWAQMVQEAAL